MNSPQRIRKISEQTSTPKSAQIEFTSPNLSSIEGKYNGIFSFFDYVDEFFIEIPRKRKISKRVERKSPVIQRRTQGSRPRQFVNDIITFDPTK